MTGWLGTYLAGAGAACYVVGIVLDVRHGTLLTAHPDSPWGWFLGGSALSCLGLGLQHDWLLASFQAFVAALLFIAWQRQGPRRRKRLRKLLGAKSKALRDAIVRKARQARQPRHVLRPVPA